MSKLRTAREILQASVASQTLALARDQKAVASYESVRAQIRAQCGQMGIVDLDASLPHVVHVAGTKGKGSTVALLDSILRQARLRVGVYTSPHLVDVRERIRIDGKPIDAAALDMNIVATYEALAALQPPGFFHLLTLCALRIFCLENKVDVLILETGIGGRLDATNAVDRPLCCAITRLDLDHIDLLGDTVAKIAFEKAGIIKRNVPVFTCASQPDSAMHVLREQAALRGSPLYVVAPVVGARIGLANGAPHQQENAGLAAAMAAVVFARFPGVDVASAVERGLAESRLPGRGQVCDVAGVGTLYLDGAHTVESVKCAARWFMSAAPASAKRVLAFHCSHDRDGVALLRGILETAGPGAFQLAIFVPTTMGRAPGAPPPALCFKPVVGEPGGQGWHRDLALAWQNLAAPGGNASLALSSPSELRGVLPAGAHVFVVGSFYLVGDVLRDIVGWQPDADGAF